MKKSRLFIALVATGIAGVASAQVDQYWNGMATSAGWATTNTGWGSTSDYGGTDVNDSWINGNNAIIEADPSNRQILESLTINALTYSAGSDHAFQADSGPVTITVLDSVNMTGLGNFILNDSTTVQGTFTVTAANTVAGANDSRFAFNNGTTLAGTVTIDGNNAARVQMNGTSTLTADLILGGGDAALGIRWNSGNNQSIGLLKGSGEISSNPGSGHTTGSYATSLTVNKLEIGTDGTIGIIDSRDQGANGVYTLDLAGGFSHQFDLSKSGTSLDNDFIDLATGTMGMDVDGATIILAATGDALELGDTFDLVDAGQISGTATFDDSGVTFADAAYSLDYSNFNVDGTITVIPEPATLGMVAFAGGALLWIRRRVRI
jgi:hypothetical protein